MSRGETLARTYCASCHVFPEPGLLDQQSWTAVLDEMSNRLGVYRAFSRDSILHQTEWFGVDPALVYPVQPVLSREDFAQIEAYYRFSAPDRLAPVRSDPPVTPDLSTFDVREPHTRYGMPLATMIRILPGDRRLAFGYYGVEKSHLVIMEPDGRPWADWPLDEAVVDLQEDSTRLFVLSIGKRLDPTEAVQGSIHVIERPGQPLRPLISGLKRPVVMRLADLNADGRRDIVVGEYGHRVGFLSWYENQGQERYQRHVISRRPGTIALSIRDLDRDGDLDVAALTAQGDEGLDFYFNDGHGSFSPERKLRFPSVYGSNYFEFVDFDEDSRPDILFTSGDNADLSPVVKPYHGVRIFMAQRNGSYKEQQFIPLNGAISARAFDFDVDGDLDIAACAYFPDYERAPENSFVLYENRGNLRFKPSTFTDSFRGRWITMDVNDLEGDGDLDVVLGSNIGFRPAGDKTGLMERWMKENLPYLILENRLSDLRSDSVVH